MGFLAPVGKFFAFDQTAIGTRARILRRRRLDHEFLQSRMNAVAGNDDMRLFRVAVVEFHASRASVLFEADAAMTGADRARWSHACKPDEGLGAVHSIHAVQAP